MILNFDNMFDREKDFRENYIILKYVGYFFCEIVEKYKLILVLEIDLVLFKNIKIILIKILEDVFKIVYDGENKNFIVNFMFYGVIIFLKLI